MGNATSSPSPSPHALSEEQAFVTATCWRAHLRDWLSLTTHDAFSGDSTSAASDAQRSIVSDSEWVTLSPRGIVVHVEDAEDEHSVFAAHASVVMT